MASSNPRALKQLSRSLLAYLLGLHLLGVPLHQHADAAPNGDDATIVVANEACPLCDWLAQPLLIPPAAALTETIPQLPNATNAAAPAERLGVWIELPGGSRAPPTV